MLLFHTLGKRTLVQLARLSNSTRAKGYFLSNRTEGRSEYQAIHQLQHRIHDTSSQDMTPCFQSDQFHQDKTISDPVHYKNSNLRHTKLNSVISHSLYHRSTVLHRIQVLSKRRVKNELSGKFMLRKENFDAKCSA